MYFVAVILATSLRSLAPSPDAEATASVNAASDTAVPINAMPDAAVLELRARLDNILRQSALGTDSVGALVVRLDDGSVIYEKNADTLLTPASTAKIFTTAAALHTMTADYQFATEVYGAAPRSGIMEGGLYVKGYGDPYLVPERLWYLANRVYFLGTKEIRGDLVVDDTYFAGPLEQTGHEQDTSDAAYMAPSGAVSVGFNAIRINITPAERAGVNATVGIEPLSDYAEVRGKVETIAKGRTRLRVDVVKDGDRNAVRVSGRIAVNDTAKSYWRRIDNPSLFAGYALKRMLEQLGVQITGKVVRGSTPQNATLLTSTTSPRLGELVAPLNKYSNNFMAAQLALALGAYTYGAPGTWEKGQRAIASFLQEHVGIAPDTYALGNASGLHDVNRLSARQLVRALRFMATQPHVWPEFLASLAVAGGSGTLRNRMTDTDGAYHVRAKTGSLSTASALAGYAVTKSHHMVAFALITNNFKNGIDAVTSAQDKLGDVLASLTLSATAALPSPTMHTRIVKQNKATRARGEQ